MSITPAFCLSVNVTMPDILSIVVLALSAEDIGFLSVVCAKRLNAMIIANIPDKIIFFIVLFLN
jgi:hypothetical protein